MRPMLLTWVLGFTLLSATGFSGEKAVRTTELAKAAAAMKVGQWRELKTKGMTKELQHKNHAPNGTKKCPPGKHMTNSSFTWTNELCWDSVTESAYLLTAGHGQPQQFFRYSERTNTWTAEKPPEKIEKGHTYNHHTVTDEGVYYYQLHCNAWGQSRNLLYRYDARERKWTSKQVQKGYSVKTGGLSYFKPLNALVQFARRGLSMYDLEEKKWSRIPAELKRGSAKGRDGIGFMSCVMTVSNPHKLAVFGGGSWYGTDYTSKALYAMDAEKRVTRLPDAPVSLKITDAVLNSDPASGDLLVIKDGELYSLDLKEKKEWKHHKDRKPPFKGGVKMAARVRDHGVLFVLAGLKVYLYKHAEKGAASVKSEEKKSRS
jgi:hypothetical protein